MPSLLRRSPIRHAAPSRLTEWVACLALALGVLQGLRHSGAAAESAQVPPWLPGRWRVAEQGWGLESRLRGLEIRTTGPLREVIVVAYEADDRGQERVWGSARLDRRGTEPGPARWIKAEWVAGSTATLLQLRPGRDGRLTALVRERPRNHPEAEPQRVRQLLLEPEPREDERRVSAPAARRPAVDRSGFEANDPVAARPGLAGLFAIGTDGTGLRAVALPDGFSRAGHPAWSPDGSWIAFDASDPSGRDPLIRVVAARGGPTTALAAGRAPSWSHDSRRLAYMASGKPEFATDWDALGRNDERIEAIRMGGPGAGAVEVLARGLWPRWSPTDDRLAFVVRAGANWDVYVRSADGLRLTRLTDHPAQDTYPVWTADGRAVVFLSDRGNRWDLYQVSADGRGEAARLTNHPRREEGAALSPDGARVAFTDGPRRLNSQVLLLDLASGAVRHLIDPADGDRDPAWSPDGRTIAFASRRPAP